MSAKGPGGKPTATYGTLTTASTTTTAASGDKVNFSDTKVRSGRAGDRLPWDTSNLEEGKGSDEAVESTALLQQTLLLARDTEDKGYLTFHTLLQQGDMLKQTREYLLGIGEVSNNTHDNINIMNQRLFRRKFQLWSIIIGMGVLDMLLVVVLFRNGGTFFPHHH